MKSIKLKKEYVIILLVILLKTIIHIIADSHSGFDGDEVLHIDTGNHLAWGYMEFPPMIGFIAWIQNSFNSDSIYIHHIFVHLSAVLIIFFCGLTVTRLGGTWKAQLLCMACILSAPCFGIFQNVFQPVIFDQFFWVLSFYLYISFIKTNKDKYLLLLGMSLGLGFLAKYSILFFIVSLFILVVLFQRNIFKNRVFWLTVCIFILIISPNLYWQIRHNLPELVHVSRLYQKQLLQFSRYENLIFLILSLNPFTILIWLTGLCIVPFLSLYRNIRIGLLITLVSFILMFISKGKFYYFYPIIIIAFIIGSVFIEHLLINKKWLLTSYIVLLLLMMPFAFFISLPLLPREQYIEFLHLKKNEYGAIPLMDSYSYGDLWIKINQAVQRVYLSLPSDEKEKCLVWGDNYSWASAVNLYASKYNIPKAISFQGSYYFWLPKFSKGISAIAIGNTSTKNKEEIDKWIEYYSQFFNKVELKEQIFNPYTKDKDNVYLDIFLCYDLKFDSETMKTKMKYKIFD
jgi:hypothetical protein